MVIVGCGPGAAQCSPAAADVVGSSVIRRTLGRPAEGAYSTWFVVRDWCAESSADMCRTCE